MKKAAIISFGFGLISLATATYHKSLIDTPHIYRQNTEIALIPFLIYLVVAAGFFFVYVVGSAIKKNDKECLKAAAISFLLFILWVIIIQVDKEFFVYAT